MRTGVVPSGLALSSHPTRHLRAGLSHDAASRLELGGPTIFRRIWFSRNAALKGRSSTVVHAFVFFRNL